MAESQDEKRAIEVEGASIDEAIQSGLAVLGVARERVHVEIVRDARRAILGFGGQRAKVRLAIREPAETTPAPARAAPAGSGRSVGPEDAERIVREVLSLMGFDAVVSGASGEEAGELVVRVSSPSGGLLIGKHGQTLDAFEYLVNRMVGEPDPHGRRVVVDVEGYRERRRKELRDMALRLAARAKERGRPESTAPLSPRDRRVVHRALAEDSAVSTRSIGEGQLRRVVITPSAASRG